MTRPRPAAVSKPPFRKMNWLPRDIAVERRPDGTLILRSTEPLRWFPDRLTDCLEQWAAEAPSRIFVARRVHGGDWRRISYAEAVESAKRIAQRLIDMGLSAQHPVAILSDNDLEHLLLGLLRDAGVTVVFSGLKQHGFPGDTAVFNLPVIFLCQNNRYAEHTSMKKSTPPHRVTWSLRS